MSNFLILGGVGFIGRNLVEQLLSTGVAKKIRVADKAMPALANLSEAHKKVFASDLVDYKQANLANPGAHVTHKKKENKQKFIFFSFFCLFSFFFFRFS